MTSRACMAILCLFLGGCAQDVFYSKEYGIYREAYDRGWFDSTLKRGYLFKNDCFYDIDMDACNRRKALDIVGRYNRRLR